WAVARAAILAAVAACALSGCGTVDNLWYEGCPGERVPYGGVTTSATLGYLFAAQAAHFDSPEGCVGCAAYGAYFLAVDLPLSAIADSRPLPVPAPAMLARAARPAKAAPAPEPTKPGPEVDPGGRTAGSVAPPPPPSPFVHF